MSLPIRTFLANSVLYLIMLSAYFGAWMPSILAAPPDRDDISLLRKKLHDQDKYNRSTAALKLGSLGKKALPAVPDLIDALTDADSGVRDDVMSGLVDLGEVAVPFLSKALQGNNLKVRLAITNVLYRLGLEARGAAPALVATLKDPNPDLRSEAAYALCRVRVDEAIPALIEVVRSDGDDGVRMDALDALSNYERGRAKSAIPILIHALEKDDNPFLAASAGYVLETIGSDSVPALARTLRNPNNQVVARASAAHLLGRIGPAAKHALPSLMEAVADPDKSVRFYAIEALGQLGANAKAAAPVLVKVTKDKLVELRVQAALSLYQVCPSNEVTLPTLVEALKGPDTNGRRSAAQGLGEVGPQAKRANADLTAALKDKDPNVRIAADLTLNTIGSRHDK